MHYQRGILRWWDFERVDQYEKSVEIKLLIADSLRKLVVLYSVAVSGRSYWSDAVNTPCDSRALSVKHREKENKKKKGKVQEEMKTINGCLEDATQQSRWSRKGIGKKNKKKMKKKDFGWDQPSILKLLLLIRSFRARAEDLAALPTTTQCWEGTDQYFESPTAPGPSPAPSCGWEENFTPINRFSSSLYTLCIYFSFMFTRLWRRNKNPEQLKMCFFSFFFPSYRQ